MGAELPSIIDVCPVIDYLEKVVLSPWPTNPAWRLVKIPAILLFKTRLFRKHPWIRKITKAVGSIYVLEGINGEPIDWPAGHFGTYFRCTPRRKYENPYIEDLYWLHEIYHLYTWLLGARQVTPLKHEDWYDWQRRMIHSEIRAACASECMAHIFIPGLREKTFKHPIWVDRFLKQKAWINAIRAGKISRNEAFKRVKKDRRRCYEKSRYDDYVEAQVRGYYQSNIDWVILLASKPEEVTMGGVTTPVYRAIEDHLKAMLYGQVSDEEHAAWLVEACGADRRPQTAADAISEPAPVIHESAQDRPGSCYPGVPFPHLAASFAARFQRYYAEFGNAVFLT